MSAAPLIECSGLGKSFGSQRVLDGIDLRLVQGEFLGLVGPNGAGKSTLLRLLLGLCRRTTGTCAVFGIDPERDPKAVRARCSYLPGETSVYREMTGDQFLAFATSFHARADDVRARRLADLFRLPLAARVRSYSAGMKQKLAILAALAVDAEIYLLDEPDRALDASMRIELHAVLRDMRRNGATFLLSSHHLEELEELCTRFEFLRAGRWVPSSEISRKGSALLHRARVQLIRVDQPPTGVRILRDYGDGRYWIDCGIDPLTWLRSVPPGVVMSAQLGQSRLRDLYEALYFEHPLRAQGEP